MVSETNKMKSRFKRKVAYTVNLYHTKCSILANGNDQSIFVNDDLALIQSKLVGNSPQLCELKVQLRNAISEYVKAYDSSSNPLGENTDSDLNSLGGIRPDEVELRDHNTGQSVVVYGRDMAISGIESPNRTPESEPMTEQANMKCIVCRRNCLSRATYCDQ